MFGHISMTSCFQNIHNSWTELTSWVGQYSMKMLMETLMHSKQYRQTWLLPRHISLWSWPAVRTRPSALLTARVLCRPSPSSCPTGLTTQRAVPLGQTWHGWRIGCSFTLPASETSSFWPDSVSTTTGYQWKRRYSSRLFYILFKIRDIIQWKKEAISVCFTGLCPCGHTVNLLSVGLMGASLIKVSCVQTKFIPTLSSIQFCFFLFFL